MNRAKSDFKAGFTLVEIMIVVAIIGLLAAIGLPNFVRARQTSQTNACINNLRVIDAAKQEWALENGHITGDTVSSTDLKPYLSHSSNSQFPVCPIGNLSYQINNIGSNPTCQNVATYGTNVHNAVLLN